MIYKNGQMQLVCLKGENENTAYFLRLDNLELVNDINVNVCAPLALRSAGGKIERQSHRKFSPHDGEERSRTLH